jgi:hypothetical protein
MDYPRYYLQEFRKYISLQTSSANTIKNYLSDLRLFFAFITENQRQNLLPQSLPFFISSEFLRGYEEYLAKSNPPATAKRRLSSLKKFIDYCATQEIFPLPSITHMAPPPPPVQIPPIPQTYIPPQPATPSPEPPFSPPVYSPEFTPQPVTNPPDYSHITHRIPEDLTANTPEENTRDPFQDLANLIPDVTPIRPAAVSPQTPPSSISEKLPRRSPLPYFVALLSFVTTFVLTIILFR